MTKVKMLRDASDYKSGAALTVDSEYELDRTEDELIRGVADLLWVIVYGAKGETPEPELESTTHTKKNRVNTNG